MRNTFTGTCSAHGVFEKPTWILDGAEEVGEDTRAPCYPAKGRGDRPGKYLTFTYAPLLLRRPFQHANYRTQR